MDEVLTNFLEITGATDAQARQILEATGHDLQQAIELFFAQGPVDTSNDAQLAQQLQGEGAGASAPPGPASLGPAAPNLGGVDDNVRAADPTRRERLVSAVPHHHIHSQQPVQPNEDEQAMNAFRDFRAESHVSDMYAPPTEIMFNGTWEKAVQEARENGAWLLVNLQSAREFASHQLNRDTWSNETLQSLLGGAFVFFQKVNTTSEGQTLQSSYRIAEDECPCTFVVDPQTGQKLQTWIGFVEAERIIEDLMPYLDTPPAQAGASFIASALKRKHAPRSSGGSTPQPTRRPPIEALTEEEQLERAIAASMGVDPGIDSAAAAAMGDDEAMLAAAMNASLADAATAFPPGGATGATGAATSTEAQVAVEVEEDNNAQEDEEDESHTLMQEALDELKPEPPADDPEACRVAFRMPDGSRGTRRFRKSEPVANLFHHCIMQQADAAGGKPFSLAAMVPGAQELADRQSTIEAAGVANAMLVMKWRD